MTFVSVVLPVHNGGRYLEAAARSILNQTHRDLELIVVDDGSTDGSGSIVEAIGDPRVRLFRNEQNRGLPAALNRGLAAARAEIVARQDADDLSHPERLEKQVMYLTSNPSVGLLGTQAWMIDEEGRCCGSVTHACAHDGLVWELSFDNAFLHTSVAFRRHLVLKQHGGYDEAWPYNQDFDLWLRLARVTRLANLPERLVASRIHGTSMTKTMGGEAAIANRLLLARNLAFAVSGAAPIDADAVELLARAREGMQEHDLRRLLPMMERWLAAYKARVEPEFMDDFRATVARQYLSLAFTKEGRTLRRIVLALWGGRGYGLEMARGLLSLARHRAGLIWGEDPISAFAPAVPGPGASRDSVQEPR